MKFPITREALQAFDIEKEREELKEEAIQLKITQMVAQICNDLKQNMRSESLRPAYPSCMYTKKFVWNKLKSITNCGNLGVVYEINNIDKYVSQLIIKLKEVFIGCDIITDPLKTYLIIDWS